MKSKFLKLYNLFFEALSDKAENLLNKETDQFIDDLKQDEDFSTTLNDVEVTDEVKENVKKSVRQGSIKALHESIISIAKKKGFDRLTIQNLLSLRHEYFDDFNILKEMYDKEDTNFFSLNDVPLEGINIFEEANSRFGLSKEFCKAVGELTGKKNNASIGPGEVLFSLLFKDGKFSEKIGDVDIEGLSCEVKANAGNLMQSPPKSTPIVKRAIAFLQSEIEQNEGVLKKKRLDKRFLEDASFLSFAGKRWNKVMPSLFTSQFKTTDNTNVLTKSIIIQLIKIVFNEFYGIFGELVVKKAETFVQDDCQIDRDLFKKTLLKSFLLGYKQIHDIDCILFYDKRTNKVYSFILKDLDKAIDRLLELDRKKYMGFAWPSYGAGETNIIAATGIKFAAGKITNKSEDHFG